MVFILGIIAQIKKKHAKKGDFVVILLYRHFLNGAYPGMVEVETVLICGHDLFPLIDLEQQGGLQRFKQSIKGYICLYSSKNE